MAERSASRRPESSYLYPRAATPGVVNPDVTQATIICKSGWTDTIRPSTSFTNALKVQQLAALKFKDKAPAHYEERRRNKPDSPESRHQERRPEAKVQAGPKLTRISRPACGFLGLIGRSIEFSDAGFLAGSAP